MGVGEDERGNLATLPLPRERNAPKTIPPRAWNVVLLDDDHHSYPYVVLMLRQLFGHHPTRGLEIARRVDKEGRAVCMTTHRELAELKQEQVHEFGADPLIVSCVGSMSAILEPAEFEGEGDGERSGGADDRHGARGS